MYKKMSKYTQKKCIEIIKKHYSKNRMLNMDDDSHMPYVIDKDELYICLAKKYEDFLDYIISYRLASDHIKIVTLLNNSYEFHTLLEEKHLYNADEYGYIVNINIIVTNISFHDMYYAVDEFDDFRELKKELEEIKVDVIAPILMEFHNLQILDKCKTEILPFLQIGDLCDICVDFVGIVD